MHSHLHEIYKKAIIGLEAKVKMSGRIGRFDYILNFTHL